MERGRIDEPEAYRRQLKLARAKNQRLVNVGLSVTVDPRDATVHLLVYGNDHAGPSDAADIGPGTLQLRSERQGNGTGRVYLVVVTATNSGGTSFDVCAVAVPHDHSPH